MVNNTYEEVGVATKCNKPKGTNNKYHVAFDGHMSWKFIDDIESLVVERYDFDRVGGSFAKDKLIRLQNSRRLR